jgi:hypothetical protein
MVVGFNSVISMNTGIDALPSSASCELMSFVRRWVAARVANRQSEQLAHEIYFIKKFKVMKK